MKLLLILFIIADTLKPIAPRVIVQPNNDIATEIIGIIDEYERLYQQCMSDKSQLSQTAISRLKQNIAELEAIRQQLVMSDTKLLLLQNEQSKTQQLLTDLRKQLRKSKRRIWVERSAAILVSASLTYIIIKQPP